jgi:hypothetical protein
MSDIAKQVFLKRIREGMLAVKGEQCGSISEVLAKLSACEGMAIANPGVCTQH